MRFLFLLFILFLSANAYAKFAIDSADKIVMRAVRQSDIVFVGKVLDKRVIKNGLVIDGINPLTFDIGIWGVEVKKVYRGKVHVGDKRYICSWTNNTEYNIRLEKDEEYVFSGVVTGDYIQLPGLHGRILPSTGLEKEIKNALKQSKTVKYDKKNINIFYDDESAVKRDACYETLPADVTNEENTTTSQ